MALLWRLGLVEELATTQNAALSGSARASKPMVAAQCLARAHLRSISGQKSQLDGLKARERERQRQRAQHLLARASHLSAAALGQRHSIGTLPRERALLLGQGLAKGSGLEWRQGACCRSSALLS